jgi:hypothetical protein
MLLVLFNLSYSFSPSPPQPPFPPTPSSSSSAEIILSVSARCVLLIDPCTHCFIAEFKHEDILSWNHSFDSFALVIGKGGGRRPAEKDPYTGQSSKIFSAMHVQYKSFFVTAQGKDIDDLLTIYHKHQLKKSTVS